MKANMPTESPENPPKRRGRPPKLLAIQGGRIEDPKVFLLAVMNDVTQSVYVRADAAKALMPYVHHRVAEGGKKEAKQAAAGKVAKGKFSPAAVPLALVKPIDTK
jgi:phage terminase small subunit